MGGKLIFHPNQYPEAVIVNNNRSVFHNYLLLTG